MNFNKVKDACGKHYMPVYSRDNLCIDHGEGNCLFDINGNKYADFAAASANILGYNRKDYVDAVCEQAHKLMHASNRYYTEIQSEYTERLAQASGYDRVFLCNSGSEANECAVKLAHKVFYKSGNRKSILVSEGAFHGETIAMLAASSAVPHGTYAPLPDGFVTFRFNDFEDFKNKLTPEVGAVLIETVQCESGVRPLDNDFLVNAYALCKAHGVLFMLDEVRTSFGRTGALFSFEHYGVRPDVITVADGIAGGLPMGACIAAEEIGTAFDIGDHGSTFGGNPLSCAAANKVLDILLHDGLLDQSAETGKYFGERLAHFSKYNFISDIRGIGLMRGIELIDKVPAAMFEGLLREQGYLVAVTGNNTVRLMPPLTITREEIDGFIAALDKVCAATCVL